MAHRKFQSHLSTTSSHSGALPRSTREVSDPKVHSQPKKKTPKYKYPAFHYSRKNFSLLLERKQLEKNNILTGEEIIHFQFFDCLKPAKKTPKKEKSIDFRGLYLTIQQPGVNFHSENAFKQHCLCFYLHFHPIVPHAATEKRKS